MQNVGGWSSRLAGQRLDQRVRYPTIREDCIYPATDAEEVIRLLKNYLPKYDGQPKTIRRR